MQTEALNHSEPWRVAYQDGLHRAVADRRRALDLQRARRVTPEAMAADPEAFRRELIDLLGWPLNAPRTGLPEMTVVEQRSYADGIAMRRVQIEVLPGLPFYGILFLPEATAPLPLAIVQHGGGGTPELTADLHGPNNYAHITRRLLERGCAVFAPQLLLWSAHSEISGIPGYQLQNDRDSLDSALRQLGGSIAAMEIFALSRSLDRLTALPEIRSDRIGMIGLSYGGFYTQMLAAVDARIRVGVSNAFFNSRYAYCWPDFSWKGAAATMLDAEICGLIAPRALCIHVGRNDAVFGVGTALPELERLKPFFAARHAQENLKVIVSDVNHRLTESGEEVDFLTDRLLN